MTAPAAPLALDGIKVVDLSRVLAGPYCGALLGDMGADVVKVEDPAVGDESRTWPPHMDGESAGYIVNNRNKRGISVNLKTPEGVTVIKRLATEPIMTDVDCSCDEPHEGRDDKGRGCGWGGPLPVQLGRP